MATTEELERSESDPTTELLEKMKSAATDIQPAEPGPATPAPAPAQPTAPAVSAAPGFEASGEQPAILSRQARYRLVRDVQRASTFLLVIGGAMAILVPTLDLAAEQETVSGAWVFALAIVITAGAFLWVIALFAVMGFGKVAIKFSGGNYAPSQPADPKDPATPAKPDKPADPGAKE